MVSNPDLSTSLTSIAGVMNRAISDAAFRQQLIAAPAATLQSAGVEVPQGMEVLVQENTATLRNLVLLAKPSGVSDDTIRQAIAAPSDAGSRVANLEAYARLVLETWMDGELKAKLLADPAEVLAERGIAVPAKLKVRVVEASEQLAYLILPAIQSASTSSATEPALMTSDETPPSGSDGGESTSLVTMATNVFFDFGALASLMTASSYLAGGAFAAASITQFKVSKDSPTQAPVGSPIAFLLIAAASVVSP
jgi:hypothetical protein